MPCSNIQAIQITRNTAQTDATNTRIRNIYDKMTKYLAHYQLYDYNCSTNSTNTRSYKKSKANLIYRTITLQNDPLTNINIWRYYFSKSSHTRVHDDKINSKVTKNKKEHFLAPHDQIPCTPSHK